MFNKKKHLSIHDMNDTLLDVLFFDQTVNFSLFWKIFLKQVNAKPFRTLVVLRCKGNMALQVISKAYKKGIKRVKSGRHGKWPPTANSNNFWPVLCPTCRLSHLKYNCNLALQCIAPSLGRLEVHQKIPFIFP